MTRRNKKSFSLEDKSSLDANQEKNSEENLTCKKTVSKSNDNHNLQSDKYDVKILYEEIIKGKDELIAAKEVIIKELNEKIGLLNEKIHYHSKTDEECKIHKLNSYKNDGITYSDSLKINKTSKFKDGYDKQVSNTLIIKPTCSQQNKETKKELGKHINPAKLDVNINRIEDFREGAVKIHCNSSEDVEKIKSEVQNKLVSKYVVKSPVKKLPSVKIVGIEDDMSEEDLKQELKKNNKFLENAEINIKVIKKMKVKYMAILELDTRSFKEIMENGVVFINF